MFLVKRAFLFLAFVIFCLSYAQSQVTERPSVQAGKLIGEITIDGFLDEPDWQNAPVLDAFLTTEPVEKGKPSAPTLVRVIATEKAIFIG